jgi:hypothetical protein
MAPSARNKDDAVRARAEYDAHLGRVEDKLETAAQRSDAAFSEHTAGAAAKLEEAEDEREAAAQRSDAAFSEHTAGAAAKLEEAEDTLEAAARKAENR